MKVLGGLAVTAGVAGILWETWRPKEKPPTSTTTTTTTTTTATTTREVRANAYTENGKSLVSIVRGKSDTDIETMVRSAVDAIGGIGKIVSSGKTVVVKPSILTSDPNCAPDPRVVEALAKLAKEAGGTVIVAESSGNGDTAYNLSQVGITSAAEKVGAEVRALPSEKEIQIEVPNGVKLHDVKTYETICNCDALISVPRLKRHGSTWITISLKNMMGTVPQTEMSRFHNTDLSQCIADLNTVIKPDLTVVDATYAMTGSGPTGGYMDEMDTIMASGDPVAIDTIGAQRLQELEKQIGRPSFNLADVKHINAAAALGVGTNKLDEMSIIEKNIS